MAIIFQNPTYLWALIAIPIIILVHFIAIRYSRARALKFANFLALSRISKQKGVSTNVFVLVLRILILLLIILSLSGTVITYIGQTATIDYILAVDISSSMTQEDFEPNRLEAAKSASLTFVDSLPFESNVGVLSFSGISFIDIVLTNDKGNVKEIIGKIEPQTIGGTDIGNAIVTGTNNLLISDRPRVIVLLTDGRSNVGVPVEIAIDYANKHIVTIHTIGIGERTIRDNALTIEEDSLKKIAELTGGKYFYVENSEQLKEIYQSLAEGKEGKRFFELSLFFIIGALVLLLIDWVLINTIYSRIP